MQNEDRLLMKILGRIGSELEAIGVVTKQAFKQVVDHFLGINREREIRINPEHFHSMNEREEVRAETVLGKKNLNSLNEIKRSCENQIYDYLKRENRDVTRELKNRTNLQADRAAELIFHAHSLNGTNPTDEDRKNFI